MSEEMDMRLKSLLEAPERSPDDAFAERIHRAVLAEQRIRSAARAAWTRFAAEMAAAGSAICAFLLLAKLTPLPDSGTFIPLFSPAAAGLLILALWVGVFARPSEVRF
ncbi:MAG: hypothetical protein ACXW2T_03335 [Allosphingosinicella sp.]